MHELQAQLADFVNIGQNTNTKKAFKRLCKGLYEIGVTAAMIRQNKEETINLFESQVTKNVLWVGNFSGEETRNILTENRSGNMLGLAGFDHQWIF